MFSVNYFMVCRGEANLVAIREPTDLPLSPQFFLQTSNSSFRTNFAICSELSTTNYHDIAISDKLFSEEYDTHKWVEKRDAYTLGLNYSHSPLTGTR